MYHSGKGDQRLIGDCSEVLQPHGPAVPPKNPTAAEVSLDCKKLVICNINHVMEILKLEGLDQLPYAKLS
jgi:hypothetical protein